MNGCVTRDKRHRLHVKDLDEPGKIGERSGQPVDLVDDHDIDPASPDIGEQALQRGPLQIAAGEPAIIITGLRQHPAFVLLAADVGLTGFALRGQRVEFLLQPLLGGFAGCRSRNACGSRHPAALLLSIGALARSGSREKCRVADRPSFNPKKSGPDHAVPVIVLATADSER